MSVVCPYCLETLGKNDQLRECNWCHKQLIPDRMDKLKLMAGMVIKCKEPSCLGQYTILKCGKCGHELPADIAQYDKYLRVAVVAPSGAGKSCYITTMLSEAKRNRGLNFLITSINKETQEYYEQCEDRLYGKQKTLLGTEDGVVIPMQWRFQDMAHATSKTIPSYSVTIFDGAGEDQAKLDPTICRYIEGSKMIILLLDPTKLAGVREQMAPDEIDKAGGSHGTITREETQAFINGLINYLKTACGIKTTKKIEVPVAVVFSKIDAVADKMGSAMVLSESGHASRGKFIETEADNIHAEIDGWMDACGDDLTKMLNANFTMWRYFGVSAFGVLPKGRSELSGSPKPLRVLDPVIWDLALEGIVESVKT